MNDKGLPQSITNRLIRYLDLLNRMAKEGLNTVTSKILAERSGERASVVRRDLAIFGSIGIPGKGYSIYHLLEILSKKMQLDRIWKVVIIGVGGFGYTLENDQRFAKQGIEVTFIFDSDPKIVGTKTGSYIIYHVDLIEEKLNGQGIRLAILTDQNVSAQLIADRLIRSDIGGIINFTQEHLIVPENVTVHELDPLLHFKQMIPYLAAH